MAALTGMYETGRVCKHYAARVLVLQTSRDAPVTVV